MATKTMQTTAWIMFGSAAEVDRLWSEARYIMTTTRSKMAPIFFEAISFLRYNRYLWDEKTVQEAYLAVKDDQKMERLETKLQELNVQEEQHEDDDVDESY
jgi:hypothetical protein